MRALTLGAGALAAALAHRRPVRRAHVSRATGPAPPVGNVTLNVATVNNGQMKDMEKLKSGVREAPTPAPRSTSRSWRRATCASAVTADVASGAGQYDIVTIGAYETPQWGANGWLVDLTPELAKDAAYDVDDILPPVRDAISFDGKQFAVPFYGESSILMYNKELLDEAGVTLSDQPDLAGGRRRGQEGQLRRRRRASACAASRAGATSSRR